MGRYKSTNPTSNPIQSTEQYPLNPSSNSITTEDWPTEFPNVVVGIDRDGVINEWKNIITRYEDVRFIPGSLEAIKKLRLRGHRVVLFADQPNISRGLMSDKDVHNIMQFMMKQFGDSGIQSIDGFYYNQSDLSSDVFAKPNIGMLKRAENEMGLTWKGGYYVGDTIEDVKMAQKIGATPILVRTGKGATAEKNIKTGMGKESIQVFDSLLDFVNSL